MKDVPQASLIQVWLHELSYISLPGFASELSSAIHRGKMTIRNHQDSDNFPTITIVGFLRFKIAQLFYSSCRFQVILNRHVKCSQQHYIPITCFSVYENMICLWNDYLFLWGWDWFTTICYSRL